MVVAIEATPNAICPGGTTKITATFNNEGSTAIDIEPGLILDGGLEYWHLGSFERVRLEPGDPTTVVMSVTVPLVCCGDYRLRAGGYTGGGTLTIHEPS